MTISRQCGGPPLSRASMRVITTTAELTTVCRDLARAEFVTVDTEFMRETTYWPILCLIQMAGPAHGGVAPIEVIVDPLAPGLELGPFYDLMFDESVVKVFHAARQDIEIVVAQTGRVPRPVFDTQVAAMVCGCNDSISYANLVKKYAGADVDKSSRFTDWSRRPLSQNQLAYALADVTYLRDVYLKMHAEMVAAKRTGWVEEEMAELMTPSTYTTTPEEAWLRLKQKVRNRKALGVLMEVAAWRERLAQSANVPRGRIMRDDTLVEVANAMPDTIEKIGQMRGLSDGFARSARAKEIVDAVQAGLARDPATLPRLETHQPLSAEATALVELLRVLLKARAADGRVAPRLIADSEDIEMIATKAVPNVRALDGWRRAVFGEDALRLKRGELALTLRSGTVVAIPVEGCREGVTSAKAAMTACVET